MLSTPTVPGTTGAGPTRTQATRLPMLHSLFISFRRTGQICPAVLHDQGKTLELCLHGKPRLVLGGFGEQRQTVQSRTGLCHNHQHVHSGPSCKRSTQPLCCLASLVHDIWCQVKHHHLGILCQCACATYVFHKHFFRSKTIDLHLHALGRSQCKADLGHSTREAVAPARSV